MLKIDLQVGCRLCSKTYSIPATLEQIQEFEMPRSQRRFVQDIFPELSVGDRELLMSGTCDTCWQELFGSDCDEEE